VEARPNLMRISGVWVAVSATAAAISISADRIREVGAFASILGGQTSTFQDESIGTLVAYQKAGLSSAEILRLATSDRAEPLCRHYRCQGRSVDRRLRVVAVRFVMARGRVVKNEF
jgi:hypothetical protein